MQNPLQVISDNLLGHPIALEEEQLFKLVKNDLLTGAVFVVFGAAYLFHASTTLTVGTAARMGPGYFPIIVGGLLVLLGIAIAITGYSKNGTKNPLALRGLSVILFAIFLFAITVRGLGFPIALAI